MQAVEAQQALFRRHAGIGAALPHGKAADGGRQGVGGNLDALDAHRPLEFLGQQGFQLGLGKARQPEIAEEAEQHQEDAQAPGALAHPPVAGEGLQAGLQVLQAGLEPGGEIVVLSGCGGSHGNALFLWCDASLLRRMGNPVRPWSRPGTARPNSRLIY